MIVCGGGTYDGGQSPVKGITTLRQEPTLAIALAHVVRLR